MTHQLEHPDSCKTRKNIFSNFLNLTRENLTINELSQNVKHDLQNILAWLIIEYVVHNLDPISVERKNCQPQNSDDEILLTDETFYVWDTEWSHPSFIIIPTDNSSQAITTISIKRDYLRITPLTIDATPINYISMFTDREGNNSFNSTFINQENLNGTGNITQQDIQTPSHFVNEEIVETMPTTTHQSISPIHPTLKTPKKKKQYFHKQLYNRQ